MGEGRSSLTVARFYTHVWGHPFSTYAPRERGGSSILYISIAYYMQKEGEGVQIACKIAYVLNGRPLSDNTVKPLWMLCEPNIQCPNIDKRQTVEFTIP